MEFDVPELPVEVLTMIFDQLDFETCWSICRVSKLYHRVVEDRFNILKLNNHLRVTIAGHVDAGKSSLLGHMLWHLGLVPPSIQKSVENWVILNTLDSRFYNTNYAVVAEEMKENLRERGKSSVMDKSTSFFAHLDTFKTITLEEYATERSLYGHFIYKPMTPDVMLMVISAGLGEFEASISRDGLTRSQLLYASTIGVKNVIFAINRMEDEHIKNKAQRFDEIVEEVRFICKRVGAEMNISFVPINSLSGENIFVSSSQSSQFLEFWDGPPLVEILKSQKKNVRNLIGKPARLLIQGFNGNQLKGLLLAGVVRVNTTMTAGSSDTTLKIKAIWKDSFTSVTRAFPGDSIEIEFDSEAPPKTWAMMKVIAQIYVVAGPIQQLSIQTVQFLSGTVSCSIKLLTKIQKVTNEVLESNPASANNGEVVIAEITPSHPICIETSNNYASLGTFGIIIKNQWKSSVALVTAVEY